MQENSFWPLAASTWGKEELSTAIATLHSKNTTMGEQVRAFEREFAAYHKMRFGIMVNSGSSANLVAVAALMNSKHAEAWPGRNPNVTAPAISWVTTYIPFLQYGAKLHIADVDLETLNISPTSIDWLPRADIIVAVSILGNPAPLQALEAGCKANRQILFEDNCESLDAVVETGISSDGYEIFYKRCGIFGLVNTFSFFYSHHISTMEGGMILTNDEQLNALCRSIRNHGWIRDIPAYAEETPFNNGFERDEEYCFILPGYNVRPLEICGAIGREQLHKLPEMTKIRRKNWGLFQQLFKDNERFIIQKENGTSSAFAFTMICRSTKDRPRVLNILRKHDIGFRMITGGNFLRHPVAERFGVKGHCPNADKVHDAGFFVGNHPFSLERQIHRLQKILE